MSATVEPRRRARATTPDLSRGPGADDFGQTLDKFTVPQSERDELFAIVGSTRADIVHEPTAAA